MSYLGATQGSSRPNTETRINNINTDTKILVDS